MMIDEQENIDVSCHLPAGEPIMTRERANKGDIVTGKPCDKCKGNGRDRHTNMACDECHGKGWNGTKNATEISNLAEVEYARAVLRNVLNYIWQREYITQEHYDAAHVFNAWRDQHRVSRGIIRPTSTDIANPTGVKLRAYGYVLLSQRLRRQDYKAIAECIEVTANDYSRRIADHYHRAYYGLFDRLCLVLSPIREQVEYLESLTEEQRQSLSEERMKIFIASINVSR